MRRSEPENPAQENFADLLYPLPDEEPTSTSLSASSLSSSAGENRGTEHGEETWNLSENLFTAALPIFRVKLERDGDLPMLERPQVRQPDDAAKIFSDYLEDRDREVFAVLMLDTKNRLIGLNVVSIGTLDSALVSPREVFKAALLANASSLILAHNHPSGDPTPSVEDKSVTKRLVLAGEILHIEVLDHLVIGEKGRFNSLKTLGVF